MKENPKVFWKYLSSKTKTKAKTADLYVDKNRLCTTSNDKEKAKVLSDKFFNVFITEPEGELPSIEPRKDTKSDTQKSPMK